MASLKVLSPCSLDASMNICATCVQLASPQSAALSCCAMASSAALNLFAAAADTSTPLPVLMVLPSAALAPGPVGPVPPPPLHPTAHIRRAAEHTMLFFMFM